MTTDPIDEMDAGDDRYAIDSLAVRHCPACKVTGRRHVDQRGQLRIGFAHLPGCWMHGALAARRRRHRPDEVDYLAGAVAYPFERDETPEEQRP